MDLSVIVEAVGWPELILMLVFFGFTVWWGFAPKRRRDEESRDDSEKPPWEL